MEAAKPKASPSRRWIWVAWALVMALMAAGLASTALTWSVDVGERWGFRGITLGLIPVYTTIGALILARHPRHTVGWLLFYTGSMTLAQHLVDEYAVWALLVKPGALPGGIWAAWFVNWIWLPTAAPLVFLLPLVYPDGRVPVRWLKFAPGLALATLASLCLVWMFDPGPMESSYMFLDNPFAWEAGEVFLDRLTGIGFAAALVVLGLGITAVAWRLRHAAGVERQQLKWFLYAATIMALSVFGAPTNQVAAHIFMMACILGLAAAVGAAILRYRLYDLDLLVNRTLVYAGLTATLGVLYLASVLLLQGLFLTLTGEGQPQLVTVLSTLTIAALFLPVRGRLQAFIDRRFFRKKYDAARTLASFGATLRDETNLAQLRQHMLQVVDETMQPAQVSLWLREPARQ
jgi:hypothetical protein